MPNTERLDANPGSEILQSTIAFEKAAAIEQIRSQGSVNIMVRTTKPGICHIGIIVDELGRSLPLVNTVASDRIVLRDATRITEYPDIIVNAKNYNLEAILKKFSEYLFLKHELQDVKINAYKNVKSFRDQKPIGILDPQNSTVEIAA